jgi:hypothetical protein
MRKKEIFTLAALLTILSMTMIGGSSAYAVDIYPVLDANTVAKWNVVNATDSAFSMYFTGAGYCHVEDDTIMTFTVSEVNDDVEGLLSIGNVSILTNDTEVARDLVLSVGIFTSFEPGLFVKIGSGNFETLNESAYAEAERVSGNFMNGTMVSSYENYTIGEDTYETIIFEYEQDPPLAGDPQRTRLIYDLETGVLLYANTSYWFGGDFKPYWLEIQFIEIAHEGGYTPPLILYPIIIGVIIIGLFITTLVRKRG